MPVHEEYATLHDYYFCKIRKISLIAGYAVWRLVELLSYKPEGRGFDSRWGHQYFSLTQSFRPHYEPRVDSASNRNEYQEIPSGV